MEYEKMQSYYELVELLRRISPDTPLYMKETLDAVLPANIIIEILELIIALEKNNMSNGIDLHHIELVVQAPD